VRIRLRPFTLVAMEPFSFWSSLVGLVLGLSPILLRPAAIKLHERALRDSRWQHVATMLASGRYVIAIVYILGYPQLLKWHFHADSIFSEWPPQFRPAVVSYATGLGIGLGCYLWRIKWRPRFRIVS
jgi:hypothetical protein